jgi:hypothetical protein
MRRGAKRLTEEKLHERRFAIDWSDLYQKKNNFRVFFVFHRNAVTKCRHVLEDIWGMGRHLGTPKRHSDWWG